MSLTIDKEINRRLYLIAVHASKCCAVIRTLSTTSPPIDLHPTKKSFADLISVFFRPNPVFHSNAIVALADLYCHLPMVIGSLKNEHLENGVHTISCVDLAVQLEKMIEHLECKEKSVEDLVKDKSTLEFSIKQSVANLTSLKKLVDSASQLNITNDTKAVINCLKVMGSAFDIIKMCTREHGAKANVFDGHVIEYTSDLTHGFAKLDYVLSSSDEAMFNYCDTVQTESYIAYAKNIERVGSYFHKSLALASNQSYFETLHYCDADNFPAIYRQALESLLPIVEREEKERNTELELA